jgi:hypothetical protein
VQLDMDGGDHMRPGHQARGLERRKRRAARALAAAHPTRRRRPSGILNDVDKIVLHERHLVGIDGSKVTYCEGEAACQRRHVGGQDGGISGGLGSCSLGAQLRLSCPPGQVSLGNGVGCLAQLNS